ncbi:MAG: hypothetical protein AAFW89_07045 [Bacteroidota bacterium]
MKGAYVLLLVGFVLNTACSNSHKLSGTNHINLAEQASAVSPAYPSALLDSLGWAPIDQRTGQESSGEERIYLVLTHPDTHQELVLLKKEGRAYSGARMLFWNVEGTEQERINRQNEKLYYLSGRCSETGILGNTGFCVPEQTLPVNWEEMFHQLERNEIWKLTPEGSAPSPTGRSIRVQVRTGDYYRSYAYGVSETQERSQPISSIVNTLALSRANYARGSNLNTYRGLTTGVLNSDFIRCDDSKKLQFGGNLLYTIKQSGIFVEPNANTTQWYYVVIQGQVKEESILSAEAGWTLYPDRVLHFQALSSADDCPQYSEITGR